MATSETNNECESSTTEQVLSMTTHDETTNERDRSTMEQTLSTTTDETIIEISTSDKKATLREQVMKDINPLETGDAYMRPNQPYIDVSGLQRVKNKYSESEYNVKQVEHRNILIIGRTRSGKSTIKRMLTDPTATPIELTLKSETKEAVFDSFIVNDSNIILNIIDTPGLFETNSDEQQIRDNKTILSTIQRCVNREMTKFHLICFCVSVTAGINTEDVVLLSLFKEYLGDQVASNSCLIITHCELKDDDSRAKIRRELEEDIHFKPIAGFFTQGVYFSGALDYDTYKSSPRTLIDQFDTITQDRARLIKLLTTDIKPFMITNSLISEVFKWQSTIFKQQEEIDSLLNDRQNQFSENERLKKEQADIVQKLKTNAKKHGSGCSIS